MSHDFQSVAGTGGEVWQECSRSVAEVWQCVTDVTDGHKQPTIYWPWLLGGIQG